MRTFKILLCLLVLANAYSHAQYCFSGTVKNENDESLPGAAFVIMANDSLAGGAATDRKGNFKICGFSTGKYTCTVSMLGYQPSEFEVDLTKNMDLGVIYLKEGVQELGEVEVTADRRNIITQGAGVTTFHLSDRALNSRDAYEALREIPKLVVNETLRTITLPNGTTPVILINGINRPGYINSLNPEDIESVEVIENPSARYMGRESVHAVLNIKMKKKREQQYVNGNVYSKHHVEGVFGISSLSLETGNSKSSVYLNAQHFYFHNDDGESFDEQTSGDTYRLLNGNRRYKAQMVYATLGGDWIMNDKNYAALTIDFITNPQKVYTDASGRIGLLSTQDFNPLAVNQYINNKYLTNTYNLFYRHTFSEDSHLDASATFGLYTSGAKGTRTETSDLYNYLSRSDLDNSMKQGQLELNYDFAAADKLAFDVGANTYYSHTNIDDLTFEGAPFIYKNWTEYVYASLRNTNSGKWYYMLSLGLDMVFTNADGYENHYINFVPSASLNYGINDKSNIGLSYTRRRTSPSASQLNPRNTSIDSLRMRVGNPYLMPYIDNILSLNYTWNHKGFYLEPFALYDYITDEIREVGYADNGIYTYTYENISKMQQVRAGFHGRANFSNYGNWNLSAYYQKDIIDNMPFSGNAFGLISNLYLYYKKVWLSMYISYTSATYTAISKRTSTPESELTFGWNLPKNWQLQLGLRYFAAKENHFITRTVDTDYTAYTKTKMTDRFLMPLIGIRYTFRNKAEYKWRQKHTPKNTENEVSGIRIAD